MRNTLNYTLHFRTLQLCRFIEHFSPYCHHCLNFAPTWTQLVEETEKKADPGIRLAQVNCAVHGGTFVSLCALRAAPSDPDRRPLPQEWR